MDASALTASTERSEVFFFVGIAEEEARGRRKVRREEGGREDEEKRREREVRPASLSMRMPTEAESDHRCFRTRSPCLFSFLLSPWASTDPSSNRAAGGEQNNKQARPAKRPEPTPSSAAARTLRESALSLLEILTVPRVCPAEAALFEPGDGVYELCRGSLAAGKERQRNCGGGGRRRLRSSRVFQVRGRGWSRST